MPVAYCCHQFKNWWLPLFLLPSGSRNANESLPVYHNRYRNGYKRVRYGFFFISVFTPKQGDFPNFATHLLQVLSSCCGFVICPECLIPTYCAFNSINDRYSLYDRRSKCVEFGICCYVILL